MSDKQKNILHPSYGQFHQRFLSASALTFLLQKDQTNHLRVSAPCLLTSLYRLLWGEYHVHRPHFTGRPSGLGVMGSCNVY